MRFASSASAMYRDGEGSYVRGRRFVLGCPTRTLHVLIGWGVINEREVEELCDVMRAQTLDTPRHGSYVDMRQIQHVDPKALEVLAKTMAQLSEINAAIKKKSAIVHPEGPVGMAVAGFWQVVQVGYPVRLFTDPKSALRWLGHPARKIAGDLAAWDDLRAGGDAGSLTDRLRELLATKPTLAMSAAARVLGVSDRTLQRTLHRDRTSFRAEIEVARVRLARDLLLDRDRSIKEVAAAVGLGSPSAFATLFRRVTGQSPTKWRERADRSA